MNTLLLNKISNHDMGSQCSSSSVLSHLELSIELQESSIVSFLTQSFCDDGAV